MSQCKEIVVTLWLDEEDRIAGERETRCPKTAVGDSDWCEEHESEFGDKS